MIFHQQKLHTFQSERQDSSKTKERHINLKEKEWKMFSDNHYFNNEILWKCGLATQVMWECF